VAAAVENMEVLGALPSRVARRRIHPPRKSWR
jgi:hypothetical protein